MNPLIPRLTTMIAVACLTALPVAARPVESADGQPPAPFHLYARSAVLIDQATGRVLFEHDADEPLPPASVAKLMSLHLVYEKLEDRSISRGDVVSITTNAFADHQEPGSSLMNLGPGQIVTVEELMKGMAVASGNDAATALAEYVAGSTPKFVRLMNDEASFLGYKITRFADPSGVGPGNRTTARELADFCRRYIDLHPQALEELHSLREFDYPLVQNMADGRMAAIRTRKQFNPNYLVWDDFGVDGLKTGHLNNDNFTAAITAKRGDMRLIVVLLGVPGRSLDDGGRHRSSDGMRLLSYGFRNFATVRLDPPTLPPVRVWKGFDREVALVPPEEITITARRSEMEKLAYTIEIPEPVVAPVEPHQRVGSLVYMAEDTEVGRVPLSAASGVQSAGLLRRAWDSVLLGLTSVVGGPTAVLRATIGSIPSSPILSAGGAEAVVKR
ncbi:MAG TPA: D-alanyl-D-alanine carboxypeptidase family protein [Spirochaetia bacterium]|nr:D-alanyl-D-alanine carboxypeptidase family protein [Spirochaetia bacterium]